MSIEVVGSSTQAAYQRMDAIPNMQVQPRAVDMAKPIKAEAQGQSKNQSEEASQEAIIRAVEEMNRKLIMKSDAVFGIHEETNRVTIKLLDKDTKEVIQEIPAEKTLDAIAKVLELAGLFVDKRR
jgi:flagellar protein FlaG